MDNISDEDIVHERNEGTIKWRGIFISPYISPLHHFYYSPVYILYIAETSLAYLHIYIHTYTHTCILPFIHRKIYSVHTYIYYTYIHTYIHTYIRIDIHTHLSTYIHTNDITAGRNKDGMLCCVVTGRMLNPGERSGTLSSFNKVRRYGIPITLCMYVCMCLYAE